MYYYYILIHYFKIIKIHFIYSYNGKAAFSSVSLIYWFGALLSALKTVVLIHIFMHFSYIFKYIDLYLCKYVPFI